ncbi:unnamed protein product [Moneuplotes crassus]|uniref:Uncharacterized protein n=1 Tax=Euplotes crassus TaxID=5936 RepID=A0AAD1XQP8_EUPCR|nr:unnamed protein product [Moneuplotes crassus]
MGQGNCCQSRASHFEGFKDKAIQSIKEPTERTISRNFRIEGISKPCRLLKTHKNSGSEVPVRINIVNHNKYYQKNSNSKRISSSQSISNSSVYEHQNGRIKFVTATKRPLLPYLRSSQVPSPNYCTHIRNQVFPLRILTRCMREEGWGDKGVERGGGGRRRREEEGVSFGC